MKKQRRQACARSDRTGETPVLRVSSESPILAALSRFDAEHGVPRLVEGGRLPAVEYVPGERGKPPR